MSISKRLITILNNQYEKGTDNQTRYWYILAEMGSDISQRIGQSEIFPYILVLITWQGTGPQYKNNYLELIYFSYSK